MNINVETLKPGDSEWLGNAYKAIVTCGDPIGEIAGVFSLRMLSNDAEDSLKSSGSLHAAHDLERIYGRTYIKNGGSDIRITIGGYPQLLESGKTYTIPRQSLALALQKAVEQGNNNVSEVTAAEYELTGVSGAWFLLV